MTSPEATLMNHSGEFTIPDDDVSLHLVKPENAWFDAVHNTLFNQGESVRAPPAGVLLSTTGEGAVHTFTRPEALRRFARAAHAAAHALEAALPGAETPEEDKPVVAKLDAVEKVAVEVFAAKTGCRDYREECREPNANDVSLAFRDVVEVCTKDVAAADDVPKVVVEDIDFFIDLLTQVRDRVAVEVA